MVQHSGAAGMTPLADRVASIQTGLVAAIAATWTTVLLVTVIVILVTGLSLPLSASVTDAIALPHGFGLDQARPWLRLGFSGATGFLFGITYRYAVRSDPANPHLKSGAIGAFALTRTFAAVERLPFDVAAIALAALTATVPLAIAAIVLEITLLKPADPRP